MMRSLSLFILLLTLPSAALSQQPSAGDARRLADQATETARNGKLDDALKLYSDALALAPSDTSILRDYAVVLGWAEKYEQAIPVVRKVLAIDNSPPDWVLREFARSLLFGDETREALQLLNQLVERGDSTEQTLARRALALRWLGRSDAAEDAYTDMLRRYPQSAAALSGLAYTAADEGRLSEALRILENTPGSPQSQPEILVARIQILNWMGRHYEAQQLLAGLPDALTESRDVLKERVFAERWGGSPSDAMLSLKRLLLLYPDQNSRDLLNELKTEYGYLLVPSFRYSKDSDGLIDRAAGMDASVHINPAHVVRVGYQYRWLEQTPLDGKTLLRYDLGWSGSLTRHVAAYADVASVDYRKPGLSRKLIGDGSITITPNDTIRFGGGGGVIAMDAFQSIDNQVTANFGFGDLGFTFGNNRIQGRYARYAFSNDVDRSRVDGQFMRSLVGRSVFKMSAGFRASMMTHSASTPDFYSPSRLHSYFGVGRFSGRPTQWLDYNGELAAGWQSESGSPLMHPFQISGGVGVFPTRHVRVAVDGGKSTASIDRIGSGLRTYSRWSASGSVEIRFP
jgi:tetratricopeptide (TPR) repeat protein